MFAAIIAVSPALGQGTVTIFGTATDTTGAVIPGVSITVRNEQTGAVRQASSDESGGYVMPLLPVGRYSVEGQSEGFKVFRQPNIETQVNENRRVDIRMEVGDVTENVIVTAEVAQVETRSGTLREVIDSKRIVELPLNGRNPLQLQYLVAGVGRSRPSGGGQAQNEEVSINGARANDNNYELDGGDNQDPFFNSPSIFPSPDALEEFSIQTSAYAADKGRSSGALMTAVTKSGTNELHGVLFHFLRNEKLNSRNFFATDVPGFKRNQYGGTLGGPIVRDRTFFFGSYQGTRERSAPASVSTLVHSAAMRAGDYSEISRPLRDPLGGNLANNQIPASRLSPASTRFLETFVPLPNRPDGLLSFASDQSIDDEQLIAKVDHRFGDSNQLSGRLLYNWNDLQQAVGNLPNFLASIKYTNWNLTLNDTHIISPSMVNNFVFSWQNIDRSQLPMTPGNVLWSDLGAGFRRTVDVDRPASTDVFLQGYWHAFTRHPLDQVRDMYQVTNALHVTRGRHLLKLGGEFRFQDLDRIEFFRMDPRVNFRNEYTGDSAADFSMGRPWQIFQNAQSETLPRGNEYYLFLQDDWKATQRLTLNLGLRWEPFIPLPARGGGRATFRPGQQSAYMPNAPAGLVFDQDEGVPAATAPNRWNNFGPRFGFALDPFGDGKMSIRGGYGVFYAKFRLQGYPGRGPGFARSMRIDLPSGGVEDPYRDSGFPFPFVQPRTQEERDAAEVPRPVTFSTLDQEFRNPMTQQWNFTVQRQFLGSYVFTGAYVGSKGNHLFTINEVNPAVFGPGPLDRRRLYGPTFSSIRNSGTLGNSTYHALQLTLNKRMAKGFTLLTNYTFGKMLDDSSQDSDGPSNPFNFQAEKSHSSSDITHRYVMSYIWELPQLAGARPMVRHVFGGWETNGIFTMQSGLYFSPSSGRDNSGTGVNQDRPNLVGNPVLDSNRPRGERILRWFDPSAFAQNAPGTFGNAGRNILQGPGLMAVDFGIFKNFHLTERQRIQFRTEVFNLLNNVNLSNPNGNIAAAAVGRITSAGDPRVVQFALKLIF